MSWPARNHTTRIAYRAIGCAGSASAGQRRRGTALWLLSADADKHGWRNNDVGQRLGAVT